MEGKLHAKTTLALFKLRVKLSSFPSGVPNRERNPLSCSGLHKEEQRNQVQSLLTLLDCMSTIEANPYSASISCCLQNATVHPPGLTLVGHILQDVDDMVNCEQACLLLRFQVSALWQERSLHWVPGGFLSFFIPFSMRRKEGMPFQHSQLCPGLPKACSPLQARAAPGKASSAAGFISIREAFRLF